MQRRTVDLSAVEILTLDEADRMLDMGFLPALRRVLQAHAASRARRCCSRPPFTAEVVRLARRIHARARARRRRRWSCRGADDHAPHSSRRSTDRKAGLLTARPDAGSQQVRRWSSARRSAASNRVGEHLERRAASRRRCIHGNKSQSARNRALGDFKAGRVTRAGRHRHRRARARHSCSCRWSSTSTCRSSPKTTSTASDARDAPAWPGGASRWSTPVQIGRCCVRSRSS